MTWKMRLLGGLVAVSMLFAGCAQGVDDETFSAGVTNAQLESPELNEDSFGVVTDVVTGNEVIQVKWPVVVGAEGYKFAATKTGRWLEGKLQPVTPEPVMFGEAAEKEVEGCSTTFEGEYGCEYEVAITTIGNKKLNNQDALSAATCKYLYYTPPTFIPALDKNGNPTILDKVILASFDPARPKSRAVFLLEPDGQYQINAELSFGLHEVEIYPAVYNESKGDYDAVETHATITFGADEEAGTEGALFTGSGLVFKHLNFDCTNMKSSALIAMDAKLTNAPLTKGGCMACDKPIVFESCWVKELNTSIFNMNGCAWGIAEFRISNSIVQLKLESAQASQTFIRAHQDKGIVNGAAVEKWYGAIKKTYILNSTIFNRIESSKVGSAAYFIRFANKDLNGIWGASDGLLDIKNSTIVRITPNKDFGNNAPEKAEFVNTVENTIFYDTRLLQKWVKRGSASWAGKKETNYMHCPYKGVDNTDKEKYVTAQDPGFNTNNMTAALDFSKPNGGLDLTPNVSAGDPRWL